MQFRKHYVRFDIKEDSLFSPHLPEVSANIRKRQCVDEVLHFSVDLQPLCIIGDRRVNEFERLYLRTDGRRQRGRGLGTKVDVEIDD